MAVRWSISPPRGQRITGSMCARRPSRSARPRRLSSAPAAAPAISRQPRFEPPRFAPLTPRQPCLEAVARPQTVRKVGGTSSFTASTGFYEKSRVGGDGSDVPDQGAHAPLQATVPQNRLRDPLLHDLLGD